MKEKHFFQNSPKAVIAFLFVALMLIGFIACSDKDDNPVNPTEPNSKDVTELLKGNWVCDLDGNVDIPYMGISFNFEDDEKVNLLFFGFDEKVDTFFQFPLDYTYQLGSSMNVGGRTLHQMELTPTADAIAVMKYFNGDAPWDESLEKSQTIYVETSQNWIRLMESTEQAVPLTYENQTYDFATVCKRQTVDFNSFDKAKVKAFITEINNLVAEMENRQQQEVQTARRAGQTRAPHTTSTGRELNAWMKDIPGNTKVRDLLLPGSHDCGTCTMWGSYMTTFGMTQMVDIDSQFEYGSRVFDLRTRFVDGENRLFHDFISCENTLNDALTSIRNALQENPSEGVIITIKGEGNKVAGFVQEGSEWLTDLLDIKYTSNYLNSLATEFLQKYVRDAKIFTIDYTELKQYATTDNAVEQVEAMFYNNGLLAKFDPDMTMDDLRGKALVIIDEYPSGYKEWGAIGDHILLTGDGQYSTPSGRTKINIKEQNDWDQEESETESQYTEGKSKKFHDQLLLSTQPEYANHWIINASNGYYRDGGTALPDYITYASKVYPRMAASIASVPGSRGICILDYVGCNEVDHAPLLELISFSRSLNAVGALLYNVVNKDMNHIRAAFIMNYLSAIKDAPRNNTYADKLVEAMVERNFSNQIQTSRVLTPTDGNFTKGKGDESYKQIFDGNPHTKWCIQMFNDIWFTTYTVEEKAYVEFRSGSPVSPKGYTITTADDTSVFPGRNPVKFKLLGKKNEGDSFKVIDERSLDLPTTNCTRKSYGLSKGAASAADMQYFRIEITSIKDEDSEWMQFSEFEFDY